MPRHDTFSRSMTRHDASESRCVMGQASADAWVTHRMTHMTRFRLPSRSACVRTRTRTRMQKSCFPVSYASCVMARGRPATLAHVAAATPGATTVPPRGRTPLTPTWAATTGAGGRDRRGVRYFPARIGPRSRGNSRAWRQSLFRRSERGTGGWRGWYAPPPGTRRGPTWANPWPTGVARSGGESGG